MLLVATHKFDHVTKYCSVYAHGHSFVKYFK